MAAADASASEDQSALLEEGCRYVAEHRQHLRKAIEERDLEAAIRHAVSLTNELRSSQLSAEAYYKLYSLVFWELQLLAGFLADAASKGEIDLDETYSYVQHEGNLLPRLYLLVTVGAVSMRASRGAEGFNFQQMEEVVSDMAGFLTAAQHPLRGLLLRYYFLQSVKDKLPLLGLQKALKFFLLNFRYSISLWSRLRTLDGAAAKADASSSAPSKDICRLDKTAHTLRLLVSAHLVHMAKLSGLTVELYAEALLPEVLRLSTSCEDPADQAFLLQSLVEAFPTDFHLKTLEPILAACAHVHLVTDLCPLLELLLRRLTARVVENRAGGKGPIELEGFNPFSVFHSHLRLLLARPLSAATPLASLLQLHLGLLMAALALQPGDPSCIDLVLASAVELLRRAEGEALKESWVKTLVDLLATPLTKQALFPAVLAMPHHRALLQDLHFPGQRMCALAIVSAILEGDVAIDNLDTLHHLFALIHPFLYDESISEDTSSLLARNSRDKLKHLEHDPVAFAAEQDKMARLVHQVRNSDPQVVFKMLIALRGYFDEGGPHRLVFTLPPTAVCALGLARPLSATAIGAADLNAGFRMPDLFGFVHDTILGLESLCPEHSLRLFLLGAATTQDIIARVPVEAAEPLPEICCRFIDAALKCMEDGIPGSKERLVGLQLITGTLCKATCLGSERFKSSASRAVEVARRLVSKVLQSKGFSLVTALYWSPACKDATEAIMCLQMALQSANGAIHIDPMNVGLFVEVLDRAASLFHDANTEVTPAFLSCLASLCAQHLHYIEDRVPAEAVRGLQATVEELHQRQRQATVALQGMVTVDEDPAQAEEEASQRDKVEEGASETLRSEAAEILSVAGGQSQASESVATTVRYASLSLDGAVYVSPAAA